jgi:hypothetical protein
MHINAHSRSPTPYLHHLALSSRRLCGPVPSLYYLASLSFSCLVLAQDGWAVPIVRCARAARTTHTLTPITSAHYPNERLYQFGERSVRPFDRLGWIYGAARTFARRVRINAHLRSLTPSIFLNNLNGNCVKCPWCRCGSEEACQNKFLLEIYITKTKIINLILQKLS